MTSRRSAPGAAAAVDALDGLGAVAIVMAGGLGTRMRSSVPKLLHPLCGRPMLAYVVDAARAATGRDPIVVTSPATAAVRDAFPIGRRLRAPGAPRRVGRCRPGCPASRARRRGRGRGPQRRHPPGRGGSRHGRAGTPPQGGRCRRARIVRRLGAGSAGARDPGA